MAVNVSTAPLERSLPKHAYIERGFYAREQESVFWNQWFYAGRADLWSGPGAYRVR